MTPARRWILIAICLAVPIAASWYQSTPTRPPAEQSTVDKAPNPVDAKKAPSNIDTKKAPGKAAASKAAPDTVFEREAKAAVARIILSGYSCQTIDGAGIIPEGWHWPPTAWTIHCDHRYTYHVEDHGGRWSVKAD